MDALWQYIWQFWSTVSADGDLTEINTLAYHLILHDESVPTTSKQQWLTSLKRMLYAHVSTQLLFIESAFVLGRAFGKETFNRGYYVLYSTDTSKTTATKIIRKMSITCTLQHADDTAEINATLSYLSILFLKSINTRDKQSCAYRVTVELHNSTLTLNTNHNGKFDALFCTFFSYTKQSMKLLNQQQLNIRGGGHDVLHLP